MKVGVAVGGGVTVAEWLSLTDEDKEADGVPLKVRLMLRVGERDLVRLTVAVGAGVMVAL